MSEAPIACSAVNTGWRPSYDGPALRFEASGRELAVELVRITTPGEVLGAGVLQEELGAVLEGSFTLTSGDEAHDLDAGQAVLIPAGETRVWRLHSQRGVLYRVWRAK